MLHTRTLIAAILFCTTGLATAAAQDWPERRYRRDGVQIRIGQDYHLPAGQTVSWPVIVIFASATLDGQVEDDVVVVGGEVRVGPTARVRGSITAVGGGVYLADAADVTGEIHDVSVIWPEIRFAMFDFWRHRTWWALFGLAGTVLRMTLVLMAACFIALVAPWWIRRIEYQAAEAPLAAVLAGLLAQLLFVPLLLMTILGLIITIVGIPLLVLVPFALLAFAVVWLAGFAGVAGQIGGRLRAARPGYPPASPVLDVAIGTLLIGLFTLIGNVLAVGPSLLAPFAVAFGVAGLVIEYLAWTVGLGAALLSPLQNRWRTTPPPVPSATPATA